MSEPDELPEAAQPAPGWDEAAPADEIIPFDTDRILRWDRNIRVCYFISVLPIYAAITCVVVGAVWLIFVILSEAGFSAGAIGSLCTIVSATMGGLVLVGVAMLSNSQGVATKILFVTLYLLCSIPAVGALIDGEIRLSPSLDSLGWLAYLLILGAGVAGQIAYGLLCHLVGQVPMPRGMRPHLGIPFGRRIVVSWLKHLPPPAAAWSVTPRKEPSP